MNEIHKANHATLIAALSQRTPLLITLTFRRLRAEFRAAIKNGPDCPEYDFLSFAPASPHNIYDLIGTIAGPKDTPYERGIFQLRIRIPKTYPDVAPECTFMTRIWHPNISPRGKICLNILDHEWSQALRVRTILLSISSVLSDPGLGVMGGEGVSGVLVPEAGKMWLENRETFEEMARAWTAKYAMPAEE